MELVFVFPVIFLEIFFINLFEIVKVIRALGIYAFVEHKVFTILFMNQGVTAVRTLQRYGLGKTVFVGREKCSANFA